MENIDTGIKIKEISKEVYYAIDDIKKISKKDILLFKEIAGKNKSGKCRLCCHKDINDKIHEMFIIHKKGAYIRPHKHLNKSESFHIIEGTVDVIIFDDNGKIVDVIKMGDYSSGFRFYYRLDRPYYHTLLITSRYVIFHEITSGPFKKSDTIFAEWSPEDDTQNAKRFIKNLELSLTRK